MSALTLPLPIAAALGREGADFLYLIAAVLFILGIKGLTHPRTAVRGNAFGALGSNNNADAAVLIEFVTGILTHAVFLLFVGDKKAVLQIVQGY